MIEEERIAWMIITIVGLIYIIRPQIMIKIKVWAAKKIEGARYIPSKRTILFYRIIGFIIVAFGIRNLI